MTYGRGPEYGLGPEYGGGPEWALVMSRLALDFAVTQFNIVSQPGQLTCIFYHV